MRLYKNLLIVSQCSMVKYDEKSGYLKSMEDPPNIHEGL